MELRDRRRDPWRWCLRIAFQAVVEIARRPGLFEPPNVGCALRAVADSISHATGDFTGDWLDNGGLQR